MVRKKLQYQATSSTLFLPPIIPPPINVFSPFEQPAPINHVAAHQQPQVTFEIAQIVLAVTPTTLVFTRFSEPAVHTGTQEYIVDVSNSPQFIVPPTTLVSVFSKFSEPSKLRTSPQVDSSFFVSPSFQTMSSGGEWIDFLFKRPPQEGFITSVQPIVIQPYVFSKFEQPQFRRNQQIDSIVFSPQPFVTIIPPVFTGFNDFGLTQQTLGSQRKQDGSSVLFEVLQPTFVPSVYTFTGFSDFSALTQTKSGVYLYPGVIYEIFVAPQVFPAFATGGGKRWQDGYPQKEDGKPKVLQLQSSNLKEMSYDEDQKRLKLVFKTYEYEKVPKKKVELLSHGKYFQKHIRDKYPTTKIPPPKGKK